MKYRLNTEFIDTDFTRDKMNEFENKIMLNTKPDERTPGTTFIYEGIIFSVAAIIYNLDDDTKYVHVKQLTTRSRIVAPN